MNRKTIKSILKKKFNDWAKTITDESLREDVKENTIITGGAIVSLLMNETPKDYDVYFTNKDTCKKVSEYYVKLWNDKHGIRTNKIGHKNYALVLDGGLDIYKQLDDLGYTKEMVDAWNSHMIRNLEEDRIKIIIRSDGVAAEDPETLEQPFEDVYDVLDSADQLPESELEKTEDEPIEKYRPVFLSPNAITLSDKIQIVIRFHGNAESIHENYDFIHCTNYWTSDNGALVLQQPALESILAKHLIYNGSKYPVCSVIRMRKFIRRGWHINAGQILKMLFQVSELDLTDIAVLEDQLIGVDSAYFMQLISALQEKMDSDSEFQINASYITTIIDKVFG
jgi:acyl carrier protein